jgi:uncharacterized protein (DUF1810 family)
MRCDAHPTLKAILTAQDAYVGRRRDKRSSYEVALREIRDNGAKSSCWIWWVWPTLSSLRPGTSRPQYLLPNLGAVRAYIAHPVLRARLLEVTGAACEQLERQGVAPITLLGGTIDYQKFLESVTLFALTASAAHWELTQPQPQSQPHRSERAEHDVRQLAAVARMCARAAQAVSGQLCSRTVEMLISSGGSGKRKQKGQARSGPLERKSCGTLSERWAVLQPQQLLALAGCEPPEAAPPPAGRASHTPDHTACPATAADGCLSVRAGGKVVIREGCDKGSARMGVAPVGAHLEVAELARTESGTTRA